MKMLFEGPVFDITGYASAARSLFKMWESLGLDFKIRPNYNWSQLGVKLPDEEYKKIKARIDMTTPPMEFDAIYQMQKQNHGEYGSGKERIVHTMFETDQVPSPWLDMLRTATTILQPSIFGVNVFKGAGLPNVQYMPFPVDVDAFQPDAPRTVRRDEFKFMYVGDFSPRKNLDMLVYGFLNTFRGRQDVILIIKSYAQREQFLPQVLEKFKNIRRSLKSGYPQILYFPELHEEAAMPGFINSCDCFVSTSHGEGFGLPLLYAMACGKPCITINWSACSDYIDPECAYPLQHTIRSVPYNIVKADENFYGHNWADPSTEHLTNLMLDIFQNKMEARQAGKAARQKVIDLYSVPVVQERMAAFLAERRLL